MLKNGEKLDGRYEVIEVIGEGGIGRDIKQDIQVSGKMLLKRDQAVWLNIR